MDKSDKPAEDKPEAKKEEEPVEQGKEEIKEEDLTEADLQLKTDLDTLVTRLQDPNAALHLPALEEMRKLIRTSTSSMTSVPKPLKFLRPHMDTIKAVFESMADATNKKYTSDIISLLATTFDSEERQCLKYRFSGSSDALGSWGHEYVRHLAGEIAEEYKERVEATPPKDVGDLLDLVKETVPFYMSHNGEAEACDLVMEVEHLELLEQYVDETQFDRVCLYLLSCVPFVPEPDDATLMKTCLAIFRKFGRWPQAMQMALKLNDNDLIIDVFKSCEDKTVRRQLAFMLGRQQKFIDIEEDIDCIDDDDEIEVLMGLLSNVRLNENFLSLARELDIVEPKSPEDIYKTHLEAPGRSSATVDSARANLASTFVNAFVNAGFGSDSLILGEGQGNKWMYKNKDHGMMSAAASLGMLLLWDVDGGLTQIDAYMMSDSDYIKAGALLAVGIVNSGVRNECDPALALLQDYTMNKTMSFRVGANMGLGLAYAGSCNETAAECLLPVLEDSKSTMEVLGVTALALGQIYAGSCDGSIQEAIINAIMTKAGEDEVALAKSKEAKPSLSDVHACNLALGLGLLYLGKQQAAEIALATLAAVPGSFGKVACMVVETCAYAGTGNVLKVQSMLHACSEHVDTSKEDYQEGEDAFQAVAAMGIAMIAMGEDISTDMALRSFNHLLQYGEPVIRRAVPLAIALLCVSNTKLSVLDTLSKLSHDPDAETAYNAILAMGLVGAGTNQARIAGMLRTLAHYYHKDANALFMVRLAQGILHTGKGSITLSPFHTERSLMSPVAVSGLLSFLFSCLNVKNTILKSSHYMLFHLALPMYPRILCTYDEDLNPVSVPVRVGQAVDVVGQAGRPKAITGWVTHQTPVLLAYGERAELAEPDKFTTCSPLLEGSIIIREATKEEGAAMKEDA